MKLRRPLVDDEEMTSIALALDRMLVHRPGYAIDVVSVEASAVMYVRAQPKRGRHYARRFECVPIERHEVAGIGLDAVRRLVNARADEAIAMLVVIGLAKTCQVVPQGDNMRGEDG